MLFSLFLPVSGAWAQTVRTLPIHMHVAEQGGQPVASAAFVASHVARANEVFRPYGVQFVVVASDRYRGRAAMDSRADRDGLHQAVRPGVINCFVVAALRDVDEPERMRRGVHWHGPAPHHYIILSAIAEPFVLAHELGHFLGNRRHSEQPGNLMSYERRPGLPFLDKAQLSRMRRRLARYLREGELMLREDGGEAL